MANELTAARWISRAVPASTRMQRFVDADDIAWAAPGESLAQDFVAHGAITALNLDLRVDAPPGEAHLADVGFEVRLVDASGVTVAERSWTGPQLVWDTWGILVELTPPAPRGSYRVVLAVTRGTIGWASGPVESTGADDGVSPLPLVGAAWRGDDSEPLLRALAIDTVPAPNPVFRRTFELAGKPTIARLSASVLGSGELLINGRRVGNEELWPPVTDVQKRIVYSTWPVQHLLTPGSNTIEIRAGRERFACRGGDVWGWSVAPWHREPTAIAALALEFADGTSRQIVTDDSWIAAPSEVESELWFGGESWALGRDEQPETHAQIVNAPGGTFVNTDAPPVVARPSRPAFEVRRLADGSERYDFGEVLVGRVECVISGSAGGRFDVISGEELEPDGSVRCANYLAAGQAQVDTVRLEGDVVGASWTQRFSYRGFRWVQVRVRGDVRVEFVRAVPLETELARTGSLTLGEPIAEWIAGATARTFVNNLHGIPTDTPIYEKNGWTADAHLATEALLHNFDLRASLGKWMDDHADAQAANGAIPWIVPTPGWGRSADPAWSASAVLIPWYLYREYGDRKILERSVRMVTRFADHLVERLDNGIWRGRSWSDWLAPGHMVPPEGMAPAGTAMTALVFDRTAAILEILEPSRAQEYRDAKQAVSDAYVREYFDEALGHFAVQGVGYRQALNVLPLAFGMVPQELRAGVSGSLVEDLEGRTDGHLDCGAIAVRELLPVLSDLGRDDLALTVLTQRTRPGWGTWFVNRETTLLESWDVDARSRNHYFLGSVSAWIQQRLGAMRLTSPGWAEWEISPVDDPRVAWGSMSHATPHGLASVRWERGAGGFLVRANVPTGTVATLRLASARHELGPGEHSVVVPKVS